MIQIDRDSDRGSWEASHEVQAIGDIMPAVLARHGLLDADPETRVELVEPNSAEPELDPAPIA